MLATKEIVNRMRFWILRDAAKKDVASFNYDPYKDADYDPAIQYPKEDTVLEVCVSRIEAMNDPVSADAIKAEIDLLQNRILQCKNLQRALHDGCEALIFSASYQVMRFRVDYDIAIEINCFRNYNPWELECLDDFDVEQLESIAKSKFVAKKRDLVYIKTPDQREFAVLSDVLWNGINSGEMSLDILSRISRKSFKGFYPRPKVIQNGQIKEI